MPIVQMIDASRFLSRHLAIHEHGHYNKLALTPGLYKRKVRVKWGKSLWRGRQSRLLLALGVFDPGIGWALKYNPKWTRNPEAVIHHSFMVANTGHYASSKATMLRGRKMSPLKDNVWAQIIKASNLDFVFHCHMSMGSFSNKDTSN